MHQSQEAFNAIQRCDEYRAQGRTFYEPRLLQAETQLVSLRQAAKSDSENNIVIVLDNYLSSIRKQDEAARAKAMTQALVVVNSH